MELAWFGSIVALSSSKNKWGRNDAIELWEYNLYDAYRDAGASEAGKQTFLENEIAFLNPLNLVDPISAGVVGYGAYIGSRSDCSNRQGPHSLLLPLAAHLVNKNSYYHSAGGLIALFAGGMLLCLQTY